MRPETLTMLIGALRNEPLAERTRVFGSVAAEKPNPRDLDVFIDLMTPAWAPRAKEGPLAGPDIDRCLARLLKLTHDHYGKFDVFVRTGPRRVAVRGKWADRWEPAKQGMDLFHEALKKGVPLDSVARRLQ